MSNIPSPILLFGDVYLCKNNIIAAKEKYLEAQWVSIDATDSSLNNIRMEAGSPNWDDSEKILLIENIPNQKKVRDFLIDLGKTSPDFTKIIVWDSKNQIKVDPKTKTLNKTWGGFVKKFKAISGSKVVNNGEVLTEKDATDSLEFVKQCFAKHGKHIDNKEANLLIQIVGYKRSFLHSDIDKLILTCPNIVTTEFIMENAYPTSKEALLYKISSALNTASYEQSISVIESFIDSGFHPNELAVVILKSARWQLVACYFWVNGTTWNKVPDRLMEMGKFPSVLWHNPNIDKTDKQEKSADYKMPESKLAYMVQRGGLPRDYFKLQKEGKKLKAGAKAEVLPHPFVAKQIAIFLQSKIIQTNSKEGMSDSEFKQLVLNRALKVYLFIQEKLVEVRYGKDTTQDLHEMVRIMCSTNLSGF